MKDIRIAFFDADGTLSDMQTGKISPKAMETLRRLRQNGACHYCVNCGLI